MELALEGKVAVVTGASKGIGLAITRALEGEGARVIAGSRETSAELAALTETGRVHSVLVDLSTPAGPADLVLLLVSDRAGNVTGADFVIDAGLAITTR